jgi:hypothetical protein
MTPRAVGKVRRFPNLLSSPLLQSKALAMGTGGLVLVASVVVVQSGNKTRSPPRNVFQICTYAYDKRTKFLINQLPLS